MSIDWRLKVHDETFTSRTQPGVANNIITSSMGVASLDTFDVDAAGNCLEASFRAVPAFVDIQPRDIIILEISTDSGSTWTPKYRGYVVTCGNPRSRSIQPYKLVGLKQRFYEKVVQLRVIDADDVATMVTDVLDDLVTELDFPAGVAEQGFDVPSLTFELGSRYPKLASVGNILDEFATAVGAFIVPAGETYTYDGVTYAAGEAVPKVMWGVKSNGGLFFRRPQASSVTVGELDAQTAVTYNEITAENVVDDVIVVYADSMTEGPFTFKSFFSYLGASLDNVNVDPLRRKFGFGGDGSTITVKPADALSLMKDDVASIVQGGTVSNAGNVGDGSTATFATITDGFIRVERSAGKPNDGFIMRVRVESTSATATLKITAFIDLIIKPYEWSYEFSESGEQFDVLLPALVSNLAPFDDDFDDFSLSGTDLKVYLMEMYVPDVDDGGTLSEEYANSFVRQATLDVATIRQVGTLGDVTQTVSFTPNGEAARDVSVERISYALTTKDGLVTTYHAGQAYDAELLSERAVLEALAKRATR